MNSSGVVAAIVSAIAFGTPLLLAGLGELLTERSGVLNLGVEGMMLMGAVTGFFVSQSMHGDAWITLSVSVVAAALAGAAMALIHAFLAITAKVNQIVSGLALTIFAGTVGLSSYLGQVWNVGGQHGIHQFTRIDVLGLKNIPLLGPIFFHQDALVYLSWLLAIAVAYYLYRTRIGLYVRAVPPHLLEVIGVDLDELLPFGRDLVLRKDGVHRAGIHAGTAIDALVGIDVVHVCRVVGVDAVDRADLDTGCVLDANAGLSDDVGHGSGLLVAIVALLPAGEVVVKQAPFGR